MVHWHSEHAITDIVYHFAEAQKEDITVNKHL